MPSDRSKNLRIWITGAVIGLFVLGLFAIAYQFGYDRGENNVAGDTPVVEKKAEAPSDSGAAASGDKAAGGEKPAADGAGKDAFAGTCGGCHVLAAAGTSGAAGPNLDDLKPDQAKVLKAIKNGGAGGGAMPKDLLTGDEADQVATFVAENAGS